MPARRTRPACARDAAMKSLSRLLLRMEIHDPESQGVQAALADIARGLRIVVADRGDPVAELLGALPGGLYAADIAHLRQARLTIGFLQKGHGRDARLNRRSVLVQIER